MTDRKRARRTAWAVLVALAFVLPLLLSSPVGAAGPYELRISKSADRSADVALDGTTQSGNIYVFTSQSSTTDITKVDFWLDNPAATGTPRRSEGNPPYDFNGGTATTATAFNTGSIPDGPHSITAKITHTNATTTTITSNFTVQNSSPALTFSPPSMTFSATAGSTTSSSQTTTLGTTSGTASFTVSDNQPWLSAAPGTGTTPATITVTANPTGLAAGTYTGTVTATASGYTNATVSVTFNVGTAGCQREGITISPLACSQVLVNMPYTLDFSSDHGKVPEKDGQGTGFTMIEPSTNGTGYIPANVDLNTASPGTLNIATTAGIMAAAANSQDNALGVGLKPGKVIRLSTTLANPPQAAVAGKFEQAGLWWGNNEDNYVKLVLVSRGSDPAAPSIQLVIEQAGEQDILNRVISLPVASLQLTLEADPINEQVTGYYSINGAARTLIGNVQPPPGFFSNDAAGIDPTIGTNTFGGIFATHRNGATPLTYSFNDFSVEDITPAPPPPPETFNFTKTATGATPSMPTSMAFGPDGKLYVSELMGTIRRYTVNSAHQLTQDAVITTIGTRLTIGIAIDPASTSSNVILWAAHSDPDLAGPDAAGNGGAAANSSVVSKLTGANLGSKLDIITGLPRSQANHTTNSIHFGPDGKLYIAQGGNTGAGAPNNDPAHLGEFGTRAEQPLSAAILVADVKAGGFDGTCGSSSCDVSTFATGLRNNYDLVWHSSGEMWSPENGAAVGPTYPPSPTPPCTGTADKDLHDPGTQNDFLYRIEQGTYYGHPNPSRSECVFKDGSYQGVAPLANYATPGMIYDLGPKKSADGIIEYKSNALGGTLAGSLLITNYSQGDNITRVKLSSNGQSVVSSQALTTDTFNDPLPLVEGPDGTIYVGEFGGNKITALVPAGGGGGTPIGTWSTKANLPAAVLDAGGTAVNGKLYFVAGKTSAGRRRTLYEYNPSTNAWATKASLPTAYPAVENPAAAAFNNKLYVFGGQTGSFTGAKTSAAVYTPSTNSWSMLPAMPVARGGATAQTIGTKIYVVGGFDANGGSLASMSIYNTATNSWSSGAAMATRRDNPGSAVLTQGGTDKLFVFGGRTRNSNGTTVNGTLSSVEMYNPATNTWTSRAAMPTGRRTFAVGNLNGRAQAMGGERTSSGGVFSKNEEYDPATNTWRALRDMLTPRHGTVAGTIGAFVYVAGGGPAGAASYSNKNEAFTY